MNSTDYSDSTFGVEQGQTSLPDEFIIEEITDLEIQSDDDSHDQLPSVEEYKTANAMQLRGANSMKRNLLVLASISGIFLMISAIVMVSKTKAMTNGPPSLAGRTNEVEDFLFANNVSSLPLLREVGSAQHRATAFVADGDTLQMPLTTETARRFVERYVLALFYYQFDGPQWTYNLKFLSGHDHCNWHEIFENSGGKTVRQGVFCNDDGYVKELNLGKTNKS
jgi:hypothetical protein